MNYLDMITPPTKSPVESGKRNIEYRMTNLEYRSGMIKKNNQEQKNVELVSIFAASIKTARKNSVDYM